MVPVLLHQKETRFGSRDLPNGEERFADSVLHSGDICHPTRISSCGVTDEDTCLLVGARL